MARTSPFEGMEPLTTYSEVPIYVTSEGKFACELETGDVYFGGGAVTKPHYKRTLAELKKLIDDHLGLLEPLRVMFPSITTGSAIHFHEGTLTRAKDREVMIGDQRGHRYDERAYRPTETPIYAHSDELAEKWRALVEEWEGLRSRARALMEEGTRITVEYVREAARAQRAAREEEPPQEG